MNNNLIDRYIYAATRHLPKRVQPGTEAALRSLVADMLQQRTGSQPPTEADLLAVLEELGAPARLAQKHSPSAAKSLIGPSYYPTYKLVLAVVLITVTLGISVTRLLMLAFSPSVSFLAALTGWLTSLLLSLAVSFTFVTLLFAFFQWRNICVEDASLSFATLPTVPTGTEAISFWEPVLGIALSILFVVIMLTVPQFVTTALPSGEYLHVFSLDFFQDRWFIILMLAALAIIRDAFRLHERRQTRRLALVTLLTNIVAMIFMMFLFMGQTMLNPTFLIALSGMLGADHAGLLWLFNHANTVVMALSLAVLATDTLTTLWRTSKYSV